MRIACFVAAALSTAAAHAESGTCAAHSGSLTPHLIELYTSEGCSSCPPADAWLGALGGDARAVGLAFHVDYWDDLGWRDTLANPGYTARQQQLAARGGSGIVYTPELTLDGREWRGWSAGALPAAAPAPYALTLTVDAVAAVHARLEGVPAADAARVAVFFALAEDGIAHRIERGENSGRVLHHARVVRALAGPLAPATAEAQLTSPDDAVRNALSVVAWIVDAAGGRVQQVLQVPLGTCATSR